MIGTENMKQDEIDSCNAAFWDELCGSQIARELDLKDNSPGSLKKFDDWFLEFYPYLHRYLPFAEMRGKRVLEVGLGYGSVSQKIIDAGAQFHGLDIAAEPVAMALHRCELAGVTDAVALQGNILKPPFEKNTFDWVVAIGCLHHTGNLPKAIEAVHRLLKVGGQALIMVYSAASYRQLARAPLTTMKRKLSGPFAPYRGHTAEEAERRAYDINVDGTAAPQTEFVTKSELRELCEAFSKVRIDTENIGAEGPLAKIPRAVLCKWLGPYVGLDLYCQLVK